MTFDELKIAILTAARKGGMCEEYHDVKIATTYQELIDATIAIFLYGWKNGIVNYTILDEIGSSLLTDNGIFYNKTGYMSEPPLAKRFFDGYEIIIIGGSPIIYLEGSAKYKITSIAAATPTITLEEDVYVEINTYDSYLDINLNGSSVGNITLENNNNEVVNLNVESDASVICDKKTQLNLHIGTTGFVKLFSAKKSSTNVDLLIDDSRIFAINTNQSTINYAAP